MTIEQLAFTGQEHNTFICMVDDEALMKYRSHHDGVDMFQVVDSFDIFKTDTGGRQGRLLTPSKQELQACFGSTDKEKCLQMMLDQGELPKHKRGKTVSAMMGNAFEDRDPHSRLHVERSGRPL